MRAGSGSIRERVAAEALGDRPGDAMGTHERGPPARHRQRQGPEIAIPSGPSVEVFTTLAISWSPEPGRYIQIVPSFAASQTLMPRVRISSARPAVL